MGLFIILVTGGTFHKLQEYFEHVCTQIMSDSLLVYNVISIASIGYHYGMIHRQWTKDFLM